MSPWIDPAQAAEAISRGKGKGVRIAILDSGIDKAHPALAGMDLMDDCAIVEDGRQLTCVPNNGNDLYGHGTAVAGIIHSNAPQASIGSFRVLSGSLRSRTATILEGARIAIDRGYHIVNCSFGSGVREHWDKYKYWVDAAYMRGIHIVAACNNHDASRPEWPAEFTSVIAVNMARNASPTDLFHRTGSLIEFAANGVDVNVAWLDRSYRLMTGSSFAAPHVTAMLAALLSEVPALTPLQAKLLLQRIAKPCDQKVRAPNDR